MVRRGSVLLALVIMVASAVGCGSTAARPLRHHQHRHHRNPIRPPAETRAARGAWSAPIALYPDALLANMLAAATYPLEVVEADRWVRRKRISRETRSRPRSTRHPGTTGVKALTRRDALGTRHDERQDSTGPRGLGDAMLAQQTESMDAIHGLREKARANNKLSSTKQQKVTVKQAERASRSS